jgi:AcrR family transcriptional regulator
MAETDTRRRRDAEDTRRRVLDAAIATVIDVGYYKASSNEIARRAGVTWGSIQHLFGSREKLMLDVVNDYGARLQEKFENASIEGDTLEDRLRSLLDVLSTHYEQAGYLVQVQILLDLSANPKMPARSRRAIRNQNGRAFDSLAKPLLARALGDIAAEHDLALYTFMTLRGYLASCAISRLILELSEDSVVRLISGDGNDEAQRDFVVRGVAATLREEAQRRGYDLDSSSTA